MTDAGQVPIAGPVFTEWYGIPAHPIFLLLVYGPPIAAVAGGLYLLGRLTRLRCRRVARAAIALVLAPTIVLGGVSVAATVKHRRTETAEARAVTFVAFTAPSFHQTRADVFARAHVVPRYSAELNLRYERGGGELLVSQVAADADDVTPPACDLHDGTPFVAWDGPCRTVRTPQGRLVALVEMQIGVPSLVEVRDSTLIIAGAHAPAGEAELLTFSDDLQPVDVADIHWER